MDQDRGSEPPAGSARFGVYCVAARDVDDVYAFLVNPDDGSWTIWRLENGRIETDLAEGNSAFVGFETDPSAIRGDCVWNGRSTTLTMYVNGFLVGEVEDAKGFGPVRGVGVIAQAVTNGADARFDQVIYGGIRP